MATQYIKYAKKCGKNFFLQIIGGGGAWLLWPRGGYAHGYSGSHPQFFRG